MDIPLMTDDLNTSLEMVPPEVVTLLARVAQAIVGKYRNELEQAFPHIKAMLTPHVGTIFFEYSTGILDTEELEKAVMSVITRYANNLEAEQHGAKAG